MKTEELISELSAQAAPVKTQSYVRSCVEALLVAGFSMVVLSDYYGLRPDFDSKIAEPLFQLELLLNLFFVLSVGLLANASAFPDRAFSPRIKRAVISAFVAYSALILYLTLNVTSDHHDHGIECLYKILIYAAIPVAWMLWKLRRLASTNPAFTGCMASLFALSVGALGVRLIESGMNAHTLIFWHYLPLILLCAIGSIAGKKMFRW